MTSELNEAEDKVSAQSRMEIHSDPHSERDTQPAIHGASQSLTDKTLQFLSTASNETLGACFVGLGACTYLILGRLGLVLIGAVGGVVLHSSWETQGAGPLGEDAKTRDTRRRQELSLEVVNKVLRWRGEKTPVVDQDASSTSISTSNSDSLKDSYSSFAPDTALALKGLTEAVIRDYVRYWYSPILPTDELFPSSARRTFTNFVLSLSSHLARQRPADRFLDFLTNSSSIVIVFLNELSNAINNYASDDSQRSIERYLDEMPQSNLANIMDADAQHKKLAVVADDILENFLEQETYKCRPAKTFLVRILGDVVLEKIIESCSKAEWINGWIIYLLEDGEPDLLKSIDAGIVSGEPPVKGQESSSADQSTKKSSEARNESQRHRKRLSKAEEAMEEAMEEARRLSKLIAEEDEKRRAEQLASGDGTDFHSPVRGSPLPSPRVSSPNRAGDTGDQRSSREASAVGSKESVPSPATASNPQFTSFDQLSLPKPTALQSNPPSPVPKLEPPEISTMTLLNAKISIFDDSMPAEKSTIRAKPNTDYLVQIEPANSSHPGWMIARKYQDFESLHEVLRRLSVVSGIKSFSEQHNSLPQWKGHTKTSLRVEFERYLHDALQYRPLAESEGMKRFLEKEQGLGAQSSPGSSSKGFPAAFENVGKGVLDVLTSAPKGAADGGKAVLGGITGAFGAVSSLGQKRSNSRSSTQHTQSASIGGNEMGRSSTSLSLGSEGRLSQDSQSTSRQSMQGSRQSLAGILESEPVSESGGENTPSASVPGTLSSRSSFQERSSSDVRKAHHFVATPQDSPKMGENEAALSLPPPPSEIKDDFTPPKDFTATNTAVLKDLMSGEKQHVSAQPAAAEAPSTLEKARRRPLTEQETQVAVELFFAIINELYTLSSAWNIRKTLLTAAKTFLLRPGNPNLESIRVLLQDSVIQANVSDAGIAAHINKMRESALPTEEELKLWPKGMTPEELDLQRMKARKLLVARGMPQALTSVMGSAASGEALGRVFDCLQVESVARGLVFGLLLQAVRVVTQ